MVDVFEDKILTIDHFLKKGRGVSFLNEGASPKRKVDVAFTIPGEKVLVELPKKKRRSCSGVLKEILSKSCDRVPAKCKHAPICGGCSFQHVQYSTQLKHKQNIINNLFMDVSDEDVIFPIVSSPLIWFYRNKMEFSFSQNRNGDRFLGLIMPNGKVFNIEECHICPEWFLPALKSVREWWAKSNLLAYKHNKPLLNL